MRFNYKFLLIFIIISGTLSSCSYLRNTPSYREEGRERFPRENQHKPDPIAEPAEITTTPAPDADFYHRKSQKLGYALSGNENPALLLEISRWLGTPYLYGGTTQRGMDCSGFALVVYRNVYNIDLERVTVNMAQHTQRVNRRNLREGDLVFFRINKRKVSHVGIYISNNKFVHASSSRGVVVNDLDEEYYAKRFAFGGRVRR